MPSDQAMSSYMLDAHGFAIVRGVFNEGEVEAMRKQACNGRAPGDLPWKFPVLANGRAIWDAMTHPVVLGLARTACGPHVRLDHAFALSSNDAKPNLHGGRDSSQHSCFFNEVGDGRILVGQLSVGVCLEPQSPATGGLCYIPGSHRAADRRDGANILYGMLGGKFADAVISGLLVVPTLRAGDVVAFSESLIHGDTGFTASSADRPRLQLYYKFCPGWMCWRDPEEQAVDTSYAYSDVERALVARPWTGRYGTDRDRMAVRNERRLPTIPEGS